MATLQVVETQEGDWGFTKDGALMHRGEPHEAKARARAQVARAAGDIILPDAGRVTVSAAREVGPLTVLLVGPDIVVDASPPDLTVEFDASPPEIALPEVAAPLVAVEPEVAEKPDDLPASMHVPGGLASTTRPTKPAPTNPPPPAAPKSRAKRKG